MVPTFGDHIVDVGQPVWDVWFPSWEPSLELGICGLLQPGNDCRVLENEDYVLHGVDMDVTWVLGLEASETLHNGGTPGDVKPELQGRAVGTATSMASISLGEDGWDAWDNHPQGGSPWFGCVPKVGEKHLEGGPVILSDLEGLVGGPDDSGPFPGKEWVESLGQGWGKDPAKGSRAVQGSRIAGGAPTEQSSGWRSTNTAPISTKRQSIGKTGISHSGWIQQAGNSKNSYLLIQITD